MSFGATPVDFKPKKTLENKCRIQKDIPLISGWEITTLRKEIWEKSNQTTVQHDEEFNFPVFFPSPIHTALQRTEIPNLFNAVSLNQSELLYSIDTFHQRQVLSTPVVYVRINSSWSVAPLLANLGYIIWTVLYFPFTLLLLRSTTHVPKHLPFQPRLSREWLWEETWGRDQLNMLIQDNWWGSG